MSWKLCFLYKTTGTWPVNQSKFTADKIAPAEGLSYNSSPIIAPSSPVKAVKTLIYTILSEETPADDDTATQHNSSTPAPAGSNLPQSSLSSSFINDLSKNHAAFLLKLTHPLSITTIPPLEFHPAPDLVPSHTSILSTKPLNPQTLSKGALVESRILQFCCFIILFTSIACVKISPVIQVFMLKKYQKPNSPPCFLRKHHGF